MEYLLHITRVIKLASRSLVSECRVTSKRLEVGSTPRKIPGWRRGRMEEAAGSLGGAGREVICGLDEVEGEVTWGLEEVVWAAVWDVVWEVAWDAE